MQLGLVSSALVLAPSLVLAGCSASPATPPLLEGVTSQGGWWSNGCPEKEGAQPRTSEALSPELTARLRREFPSGTPAATLEMSLRRQGFGQIRECDGEPSVRTATFRERGGGLFQLYSTFAVVAWKQDETGKILWTKGHVDFTGP